MNKIDILKNPITVSFLFILTSMFILVSPCQAGQLRYSNNLDLEIPFAFKKDDIETFFKLDKEVIKILLEQRRVVILEPGTKYSNIEGGFIFSKIMITSGPHRGSEGWVGSDALDLTYELTGKESQEIIEKKEVSETSSFEPKEIIYLKNGSSFKGKILEEKKNILTIEVDGGKITFNRNEIKNIEKIPLTQSIDEASQDHYKTGLSLEHRKKIYYELGQSEIKAVKESYLKHPKISTGDMTSDDILKCGKYRLELQENYNKEIAEKYNISEEALKSIRLEGQNASWPYPEEKVKLP